MVECCGGGGVLGSGGNMAEMDKKKSVLLFCTLLYNFLASYGSLKDDDPNRYLIDLST
jgi:hypothetical protein